MLALDVQDSEVWHSCLVLILHRHDPAFLHFLEFCDSQETDKFRPRNRGGFYARRCGPIHVLPEGTQLSGRLLRRLR
jgi:hypothetical protein